MKLAKLSLAAIAVVGLSTSSFAADTLADAFKNGTVNGTIRSLYRDNSVNVNPSVSGFALGGQLGYVTDSFNGFSAGFTFQTSHTLGLKEETAAEVDGSVAVSRTDLSEAYLAYAIDKTTIKVGRQYIDTPLASSSTSRMYNDTFEALTIVNTSLPNTTLVAGYVQKFQDRFADIANLPEPIYTVMVANSSVKGLDVTAQYTTHKDDADLLYVDLAYAVDGMPLTVGAQYIGEYSDDPAEEDTYIYGLMASTSVAGFGLSAYYNSTSDDGDVKTGYGQGTDWTYNSVQWMTGTAAGTESYQGKISYDFSQAGIPGLSAFARYATYQNSVVAANDADELNLDASYAFSGALKGLDIRVRYANVDFDSASAEDGHDFRFYANYNF